MAEVRLRLGPGAGRMWMKTACVLCSACSKGCVRVTRAWRGYGASPGRSVMSRRAYGTSEEIPLCRLKSAYYDILRVSRNATQAQIKTAYYKQSFIFHPDKNAGSEDAASRFAQISEAYAVLGNKTLRKKYDGGVLSEAEVRGWSRASEGATRGSSGRVPGERSSAPAPGAPAQNAFDFDAFYRAHYGEQLQRQKDIRARLHDIKRQKEDAFQERKLGRASEIAVGVMLALAAAVMFSMKATKA